MNDLIKQVLGEGSAWPATIPLVLFVTFFVAVVIWTWRQPDLAPPLE